MFLKTINGTEKPILRVGYIPAQFVNSLGCDSIVTLDLNILNSTGSIDTKHLASTHGLMVSTKSNNTATHLLTNSLGCDSIITLD